jgi:hypothetical protein
MILASLAGSLSWMASYENRRFRHNVLYRIVAIAPLAAIV